MNQDQIDAGFAHVRSERFLRAHAGQVRNPRILARLHPATVELEAPIPFDARLSWIGASLGIADVWKSAGERHA